MDLVLLWWFVVLITGLAAFPIAFVLLKHFPDKGYAFSKVLSLLILGYLTWILGYLSFGGGTIFVAFIIILMLSGVLLWTWIGPAFFEYLKKDAWNLLLVELLFLVAFLVAGAYKMRTHDISGQEKPMDFTFINGILSSGKMPPQDPWLSGGSISYYYFGYLIVAVLCKISQVAPGEAFNLAIAMTWALSALAVFSLAYALTRRYRYSFISAVSAVVLGNMDYWHRAIQSSQFSDLRVPYYNAPNNGTPGGLSASLNFLLSPLQHGWDYFQASRIIPVPAVHDKMINEFPAFSFFLSDLHPHLMGIPYFLLAAALAFNVMKTTLPGIQAFGAGLARQVFHWVFFILAFGGLFFMNSWDFPTLMLLLGLCLFLQQWWANEKQFAPWLRSVVFLGVPIAVGWAFFYFPFLLRLQSQAQGIGLVNDRTDIYYLFVIFGFFFVGIIPVLVGRLAPRLDKTTRGKVKRTDVLECVVCGQKGTRKKFCGYCGGELIFLTYSEVVPIPHEETRDLLAKIGSLIVSREDSWRGWISFASIFFVISFFNFIPFKFGSALLALLCVLFCLISLASKLETKEMVFSTLLVLVAFSIIFGCEVFYMKDLFAGALYRMNTVFKFHYQAWILLSIALGPFLKWFFEFQWPQWVGWKKVLWSVLAIFVLGGAGMYPLLAFGARMNGTSAELATMDGSVFYERSFPVDHQAAQWISANVKLAGGKVPIILEAWGDSYMTSIETSGGRIATLTGYPTILGWAWHEVQWRGSSDKAVVRGGDENDTIQHREADIDALYISSDVDQTRNLLRKYKVDYVYVGDVERAKYKAHPENLNKFSQFGSIVFQAGGSVLYKINS